ALRNKDVFSSDPGRISVLLNNLISNAIRYQNPNVDKPYVDIAVETTADAAFIVVKDNGIGIDKAQQSKVFDMFYRVSQNSVGSGLGLYIVKETVEKLQGKIDLKSEPGTGTAFTIVLPNLN
ncbi:MAG TPA: HAMP domain-containing sensor histidine kinase, partial [Chitinophagales bacterium]|nr:HAMP domain-containing sensor histidine kinase [Chitinophagales bacterium]